MKTAVRACGNCVIKRVETLATAIKADCEVCEAKGVYVRMTPIENVKPFVK